VAVLAGDSLVGRWPTGVTDVLLRWDFDVLLWAICVIRRLYIFAVREPLGFTLSVLCLTYSCNNKAHNRVRWRFTTASLSYSLPKCPKTLRLC
jgi:hypothetical protein